MIDPVKLFLADVEREVASSRAKFPSNKNMIVALTEEVGELAKGFLDLEQGKHHRPTDAAASCDIYEEAVQVAAMGLRIALEGDAGFGKYNVGHAVKMAVRKA